MHVDARLLDKDGRVWHLGHREKMTVMVDSDDNLKLQQKQRDIVTQSQTVTAAGGGGAGGKGGHKGNT